MELKDNCQLQNGEYRIVRKIGRGGFGITYHAEWTTEVTGPMGKIKTAVPVAIKEFFFEEYCTREPGATAITITSATGREMFERFKNKLKKEAHLLSKLQHPNVVRVLDVFEENNTAYIVMAFIVGESLKDKIRREGKIDEAATIKYAGQLCDALAEIHSHKILHLDIKPGNVLIDNDDNVQLIDFGISKQYNESHQETSTTPVGISKGFAPVEQYSGVQQFTPSTDVYALGATMYNMLTGTIPTESILHLDEPLKPVRDYSPDVSVRTEAAVAKAMSMRRPDRHQTVDELKRGLEGTDDAATAGNTADKPETGNRREMPDETVVDNLKGGGSDKTVSDDTIRTDPPAPEKPPTPPPPPREEKKGSRKMLYGLLIGIGAVALSILAINHYLSDQPVRPTVYKIEEPVSGVQSQAAIEEAQKRHREEQARIASEEEARKRHRDEQARIAREAERARIAREAEQARIAREAEQKKIDLRNALNNAETAFANKQYSQALTYYKKVKELSPGDDTGYNRFVNKAKELALVLGEYDGNAKTLLLNARELKNTAEVNSLIALCK